MKNHSKQHSVGVFYLRATLLALALAATTGVPGIAGDMRITGIRSATGGGMVLDVDIPGAEHATFDVFGVDSLQGGTNGGWRLVAADLPGNGQSTLGLPIADSELTDTRSGFFTFGRSDIDTDGDGLPDAREMRMYATRHTVADSDGDGMRDGWEVGHALNPLTNDAAADSDGDGFSNLEECRSSTDPCGQTNTPLKDSVIKGMRVGPGDYYGGPYEGMDTDQIVDLIVGHAVEWGVNRLFVHAAFTTYGVTWADPTTPYMKSSGGHGKRDIFPKIIAKAHEHGIRVLAYMEPTRIQSVWEARPDWRAKDISGNDLTPERYLLSPFNEDYLDWLDGYINEVLDLGADGIDIAECDIGVWGDGGTYDAAANQRFFQQFPNGTLGDSDWLNLRTQVVTGWYARMGRIIKARQREFHVTYVWNAKSDGSLINAVALAEATGFCFDSVCNLPEDSRPDYLQAELIWQSRAAKYGPTEFNAEWTAAGADQFVSFVNGRTKAIVHVEATPFSRNHDVTPQPDEIETSLRLALEHADGADIYDHDQLYRLTYNYQGTNANWGCKMVARVYGAAQ